MSKKWKFNKEWEEKVRQIAREVAKEEIINIEIIKMLEARNL